MRTARFSKEPRNALLWSATVACAVHASLFVLTEAPPRQLAVLSTANISGQTEQLEFSVALEQRRSEETESASNPAISQPTAVSPLLLRGAHSAASAHTMKEESALPQTSDFDAENTFHESAPVQRMGMRGARSFGAAGASPSGRASHTTGISSLYGASHSNRTASASPSSALKVKLLASTNCSDLFPYRAKSESGTVLVELTVDATGTSHFSKVVEETPLGQGFGRAAEMCAERLRFSTSENPHDLSLQAHPIVRLEFEKSS